MKYYLFLSSLLIPFSICVAQSSNTFPSNGNVGIGTLTPQTTLHVNGSQILNGDLTFGQDATAFFIKGPANGGAIRIRSNGNYSDDRDIQFGNINNNGNWSSFMTVAQNGFVGIGTTNPIGIFHIKGNAFIGNNNLILGSSGSLVQIDQGASEGNTYSQIRAFSNGGTIADNLILQNHGGNVGIGTTSPFSKLHIKDSAYTGSISLGSDSYPGIISSSAVSGEFRIDNRSSFIGYISFYPNGQSSVLGSEAMRIVASGNIGIGTSDPKGYKLAVNGKIRAQEIKVETANWPDYVFAKSYELPTLEETEKHIKEKGHLPGIPSAEEVKTNGIDLGEMNAKLLQKIEELTLHLIRLNQNVKMQNIKLEQQNIEIERLKENQK